MTDLMKRWIAALRSGEYKQGQFTLFNPEEQAYCCLGVLCVEAGVKLTNDGGTADMDTQKMYEVPTDTLEAVPLSPRDVEKLVDMNDHYKKPASFSEIADFLEQRK